MAEIEVKALIDVKKNKVIFVESNADLVDMLFSFLTMPMGNIIKLTRNQPSTVMIGRMDNLYKSVESLDVKYFQTSVCRSMLLCPRNGVEARIRKIRPSLEDDHVYDYFRCNFFWWCPSSTKLLSYYKDVSCHCGQNMCLSESLSEPALEDENGGVFVRGLTRYLISDELQIVPLSTVASFSVLSKQGDISVGDIEERTFGIGVNEILNLLKSSLVSNMPLTETLLKNNTIQRSFQEYTDEGIALKQEREMYVSGRDENTQSISHENISVKLLVSKTKAAVCYAEADEDFINLLLSFLTVPLGIIAKEMCGSPSKGCSRHLYESVQSLDATKYLISDEIKQFLLSPKIAPHFGFDKQLLSVEESTKHFYYAEQRLDGNFSYMFATDKSLIKFPFPSPTELTLLDPKSSYKKETKSKGRYVKGPTMFTVTDSLVITPISPLSGLTILKKLNVPFNDIEERTVLVGKEEATRLLVASLTSESPLTNVFSRQVPKQEY